MSHNQSLNEVNNTILKCDTYEYKITTGQTQYGGLNYGDVNVTDVIGKFNNIYALIPVIKTPGMGINILQTVGIRENSIYLQSSSIITATIYLYVLHN